jgi:hypothetical protein
MFGSRREFLSLLAAPLVSGQGMGSRVARPTARSKPSGLPFLAHFVDIGKQAGLHHPSIYGAPNHKEYILETVGCGCAFFDYDNDGEADLFVANGFPNDRIGVSYPPIRFKEHYCSCMAKAGSWWMRG